MCFNFLQPSDLAMTIPLNSSKKFPQKACEVQDRFFLPTIARKQNLDLSEATWTHPRHQIICMGLLFTSFNLSFPPFKFPNLYTEWFCYYFLCLRGGGDNFSFILIQRGGKRKKNRILILSQDEKNIFHLALGARKASFPYCRSISCSLLFPLSPPSTVAFTQNFRGKNGNRWPVSFSGLNTSIVWVTSLKTTAWKPLIYLFQVPL